MRCRVADLRCKEVINISDGLRLGYICDVYFDTGSGKVLAVVVPGRLRFLGIFGREDDIVIPWECITKMGNDIVLVEIRGEYARDKRERRKWF